MTGRQMKRMIGGLALAAVVWLAAGTVASAQSNMVLLIVNSNLYVGGISSEVLRLQSDLQSENYTTKIKMWPSGDTSSTNLWNYLKSEYTNPAQGVKGALLLGSLPKPQAEGTYNELLFWNMNQFQTNRNVTTRHIWVSRINVDNTTYGSEVTLMRRALDANHAYRRGLSRLPFTAYRYKNPEWWNGDNKLGLLWPAVEQRGASSGFLRFLPERPDLGNVAGADCMVKGGELFEEESHGYELGYMYDYGEVSKDVVHRNLVQARVCLIGSCTTGRYGDIANEHIFSKGGGCVLVVSCTEISFVGETVMSGNSGFINLLESGMSWGDALVQNWSLGGTSYTSLFGDLSIRPMASVSANAMPVITAWTPTGSVAYAKCPVTFSATVTTDPGSGVSNVQYYCTGYDYGRGTPTYTGPPTNFSYTYNTPGTYKARIEVMDKYMARTWREVTVTVVNDVPVANAGTNQMVATGTFVGLDGRGSRDPGGKPLAYRWTQLATGAPAVTLSGSTTAQPTFTPAGAGSYQFRLVVSNGLFSATNSTTVTAIQAASPVVTNSGPAAVSVDGCTLRGIMTSGGVADVWICWGANDAGIARMDAWEHVVPLGKYAAGTSFGAAVAGLDPNATCWYRCFVSNSVGSDWSDVATGFGAAPSSGGYSMKITFTNFAGRGVLTNFPVLVKLTPGNTMNYAGFMDGYDLRFWLDDSQDGAGLNYEIEKFDRTSNSFLWVQVPVFSNNCAIWASWGDTSRGLQLACTTNGATWSEGFLTVQHMAATNGNISSDSATLNSFTIYGAPKNPDCMIGGGYEMTQPSGNGQYLDRTDSFSDMGNVTITFWTYPTELRNWSRFIDFGNGAGADNVLFARNATSSDLSFYVQGSQFYATNALALNEWQQFTATRDSASGLGCIYRNGVLVAGPTAITAPNLIRRSHNYIGRSWWGTGDPDFKGKLDEFQISSVARSSNWVWACWMNQGTTHASFAQYGAVTSLCAAIQNAAPSAVSNTSARLNATLLAGAANYKVSVYWGPVDGGTNAANWPASAYVGAWTNIASTNVGYSLSGLQPGSTYYYTFRATNASATVWATPSWQFSTLAGGATPVLENREATGILDTSAVLRASLYTAGTNRQVRVYWGPVDGGTNSAAWANSAVVGAWTNVAATNLSYRITGLSPLSTYCFRFHAVNASGGVWAQPSRSFTTAIVPSVSNGEGAFRPVAGVARLRGTLVDGSADAYLYWGAANGGTNRAGWANVSVLTNVASGSFSSTVSNLIYGVAYHYRYYVSNSVGAAWAPASSSFTSVPGLRVTAGLSLWLDASATDSLALDGVAVAEWRNRLGGSAKAVTRLGAPVLQPSGIGGLPTVHFDKSSWMGHEVSHPAPVSILYVSRQTGVANGRVLGGQFNNIMLGYHSGYRDRFYLEGWVNESSASSDTLAHLYAATIPGSGNNTKVYGAGTLLASNQGGVTGPDGLELNGYNCGIELSDCDISEVLVYDRVLTSAELDAAGGYLASKYGLVTSYSRATGGSISNAPATGIASTAATLNGVLECSGAVYDVHAHWGTSNGGTNPAAWANSAHAGSWTNVAATDVSWVLGALSPNTTYYFTFRGSNACEQVWSPTVLSFKTPSPPAVNNATGARAGEPGISVLNGALAAGGPADVRIYWGPVDGGTNPSGWGNVISLPGRSDGAFSSSVSNLLHGQAYYYRCHASNTYGSAWAPESAGFVTVQKGLSYQLSFAFTNYNRAETLVNFPVLVVFSNNMANSGFDYRTFASDRGYDLRFTDSSGMTNLNYEIDSWNTGGCSYAWVQVPAFRSNCSIQASWGDPLNVQQPASCTNGATWGANYMGVWHLRTTNAAVSCADSSGNRHDGTGAGLSATNGVVDGASAFAGGGPCVNVAGITNNSPSTFTASAFINYSSSANTPVIMAQNDSASLKKWALQINASGCLELAYFSAGGGGTGYTHANTVTTSAGAWHHVAAVYDVSTTSKKLYVDGQLQPLSDSTLLSFYGTVPALKIGGSGRATSFTFNGRIDEARLNRSAESSNWVWACYMNMASNSVFNSPGKVLAPAVVPALTSLPASSVTAASAMLNANLNASGTVYTVYAHWGSSNGGTNAAAWANTAPAGSWTNVVSTNIGKLVTVLAPVTTYYFTFRGSNACTNVWATNVLSFTTASAMPSNTLQVVSAHGVSAPPVGMGSYASNSWVTCSITNSPVTYGGTQYVCTGWVMTGNAPFSGTGTNFTMRITNNAALTWRWSTNYWINLACLPESYPATGTTNSLDKVSGWCVAGSNIAVIATAGSTCKFSGWAGTTNGCSIAGTQIVIPADRTRAVDAVFVLKKAPRGTAEVWLTSFNLTNGTPDQVELLDVDGDGAMTWQEYIAGTDPTNKSDVFGLTLSQSNGMPVVQFLSRLVSGGSYDSLSRHYALEYQAGMISTNWLVVASCSNITATGQTVSSPVTPAGNLFYRAKAWLE